MPNAATSYSRERSGDRKVHRAPDKSDGLGADHRCLGIQRPMADRDILQNDETEPEDHQLSWDDPECDALPDMGRDDCVSVALIYEVQIDTQMDGELADEGITYRSVFTTRPHGMVTSSVRTTITRTISEPSIGNALVLPVSSGSLNTFCIHFTALMLPSRFLTISVGRAKY